MRLENSVENSSFDFCDGDIETVIVDSTIVPKKRVLDNC
jgi:hypothetical protein